MSPSKREDIEYTPLRDSKSEESIESYNVGPPPYVRHRLLNTWFGIGAFALSIAFNIMLGVAVTTTLIRGLSERSCVETVVYNSPAREAVHYDEKPHVFDRWEGPNKYFGPPSDEIDYQWKKVVHRHIIAVPEEIAQTRVQNTSEYWRIPAHLEDEYGPGILGGMEFGHHLHCINLLRKFSHLDYYKDDYDLKPFSRDHIDHCFDLLRQAIMCNPDVGLYAMYWVEGKEIAEVDIAMPKKCRNFDDIMVWAKAHEIGEYRIDHRDPGTDVIFKPGEAPAKLIV